MGDIQVDRLEGGWVRLTQVFDDGRSLVMEMAPEQATMVAQALDPVVGGQLADALRRVTELATDIDNHREFWRRGQDELEIALTEAARARNRNKVLERRDRERRGQGAPRRQRDVENEALRDAVVSRYRAAEINRNVDVLAMYRDLAIIVGAADLPQRRR